MLSTQLSLGLRPWGCFFIIKRSEAWSNHRYHAVICITHEYAESGHIYIFIVDDIISWAGVDMQYSPVLPVSDIISVGVGMCIHNV